MARTAPLFTALLVGVATSALIVTSALAGAGALAAPPTSAEPSSVQETEQTLRDKFDQARELGNKKGMKDLLARNEEIATNLIVKTAEQISAAPNEVLVERYAALSAAWDDAFDSEFPAIYERMFASMRTQQKEDRLKLRREFEDATRRFGSLQTAKDAAGLLKVAEELRKIAGGFEKAGDKYFASQSFLFEGIARDTGNQGTDADLDKTANAYVKCVELRADFKMKDAYYKSTKQRADQLVALGHGGDGSNKKGPKAGAPKKAGEALVVQMEFEEIDARKDTQRPSYYLDEHRQIWPNIALKKSGTSMAIPRMKGGPNVIRETSAKIMVDVDSDGAGDIEWPTRGKFEAFTFDLGEGDEKRPWRIMTEVGRQEDFYQGQPVNLLASDDQYIVYYIPAGAMAGTISGVKVQVIDDNLDGIYGSIPQNWGHQGLVPETSQPEMDSIRIGGSKSAQPFSEYVDLGGKVGWHKLEIKKQGLVINAQPVTIETGTLQLKQKGLKPDFLVLQGVDKQYANTYIDISGGKKVNVPVGKWKISFGMVSKGKGMQRLKAVILGGKTPTIYEVAAGENVTIQVGSPYKFEFTYEATDGKVTVDGKSVHVVGAGGEIYDRLYNCVHYPVAGARRAGSKRASAEEKMKPVVDNNGLAKHGWASMWKPLNVEMTVKADEVEVQLVEKKNKLFGKLESDWK